MLGYMGSIIRVNLNDGSIGKEPLDKELIGKFVGGRGLNSKILYDEVKPGTDPLGPDNKVIMGAGPCNGTIVPGSCRFTVTSKSPMTGLLGDSNAGGFFGAEIKYAGYDLIIIEGKSDAPVYLWIDDDKVELRPARHLWGKTPRDTIRAIQKENLDPGIHAVSIGPGGENLVRFANLITELGRALGRTGQGAVFGSKRLKAVAIRGTKGVKVANLDTLEEAVREIHDAWTESAGTGDGLNTTLDLRARYGPAVGWNRYAKFGMFGTKNFQGGAEWKRMLEELDDYFVKPKACFSCPAACNHMFVATDGTYAGTYGEGIELTTVEFGPNIGNESMALNVKLHEQCDLHGIDYFETRGILAFATECYEKGILTKQQTDGLELKWGSADAFLKLAKKTATREGFGNILAEGVKGASDILGKDSAKYAMQAKGQTLVERDPRASKGWGLAYAVSTRGPCHVRAYLPEGYSSDAWDASVQGILKKYKDPTNLLTEEGKGELVKWHEDLTACKNSLEVCLFAIYPWTLSYPSVPKMLARLYNAVTGLNIDEAEVLSIGERIVNIERAFNLREGLTKRDDTLPDRILNEPYPDGPAMGQVVNLDLMLNEYYESRGWDKVTGFPKMEKLAELQLKDVANELQSLGKLAI